jgi:hypothetical protein
MPAPPAAESHRATEKIMSNTFHSSPHILDSLQRLHSDVVRIRSGEAPTHEDLERAPILDCWRFGVRPGPCLLGLVFGHPLHGDRRLIRTSEIFAINTVAGWARTWSRFYRLGIPDGGFPGGGNA